MKKITNPRFLKYSTKQNLPIKSSHIPKPITSSHKPNPSSHKPNPNPIKSSLIQVGQIVPTQINAIVPTQINAIVPTQINAIAIVPTQIKDAIAIVPTQINAIVFFCYRPPIEIFRFASLLKNEKYDIFVAVNDNNYKIPVHDSNITIIKIDTTISHNAGYFNSNTNIPQQVSARDKAFYYFNRINRTDYKHIWFIEEDVFIPTIHTISDLDKKYLEGDYMSNSFFCVYDDIQNLSGYNIDKYRQVKLVKYNNLGWFQDSWAFKNIKKYFPFPWLKGMSCAIRMSKSLLTLIDQFAIKHNTLIMDEILYLTCALQNNLTIITPIELSSIVYHQNYKNIDNMPAYLYWNENDIKNKNNYIFHPIKNLQYQQHLRTKYGFL